MPTKTEGWNTANAILLLCETSANEVGSENWAVSTFESIQNQPSCACCMLGCKAAALMLAGVGCCALRLQQQQQQSWYSGATSQPVSHSPSLSLSHARTHTCSLSLSSVTLVTYFLHGNSISCCAHRKKERRKKNATWSDWNVCVCVCVTVDLSWEIWPTVQMRLSYYCSACLTTKLTVWLSSGPVKHNSRWQAFIIRM